MPFYILEVLTRYENESFAFIEKSKDLAIKESERILAMKSENGEFSNKRSKTEDETAILYSVEGKGYKKQNYLTVAYWDIMPTKNNTSKHKFIFQRAVSVS